MSGLFSGFVRWLRWFRVRPLKLGNKPDRVPVTSDVLGDLWANILAAKMEVSAIFAMLPFGKIHRSVSGSRHRISQASAIFGMPVFGSSAFNTSAWHRNHNRPARARRQALFVLDRPWEAPKTTCS